MSRFGWGDNGDALHESLVTLAAAHGDDPRDEDWVPEATQKKRVKHLQAHPKFYVKGPDVGSKSTWTQRRHRKLLTGQTNLDNFIQKTSAEHAGDKLHTEQRVPNLVPIHCESITPPPLSFNTPSPNVQKRKEKSPDERVERGSVAEDSGAEVDEDIEGWEEDVSETVRPHDRDNIRGWAELRTQIKEDLKKKHSKMCLSEINQLMILRNFATLCLKGHGRIASSNEIAKQWHEQVDGSSNHFACRIRSLARHYQIFEQLPIEACGGSKNVRSLLKDETVKIAACTWLTEQRIGSVTPQAFCHALNSTVLPFINISQSKPLSERTTRGWLVKLGWTWTTLRKGVYMDGHEREDVVKYRNDIFLPAMAKFEKRMIRFEGPQLKWVEPTLLPGECILIAEFHDESCCQQNEFKTSAWVQKGEQILQKKGQGRLIHISDFIEEVNGCLVSFNNDGMVEKSACKVIFPGANGDPYWDCAQLIEQVKSAAIPTLEAAHPRCQALFIFDQSLAHAALPPDALKAFEMNKSNGGKQRRQKDTIIPDLNPTPEYHGILQRMTTDSGQQKGLEQTLKERGFNVSGLKAKCSPVCPFESQRCCMARLLSQQDDFINQISMLKTIIKEAGHECIFLPKFHCELNPIEMVLYRQVPKKSFEDVKKAAFEALDSCPVDVIRWFINRAWRFMSAYRIGLTGKAAAWAVRKQKGHRTVSQAAMMHLDAILS
ncbi:hypothetical protein K439DRAFT_1658713 [Ramaria rubella]|nr:hypothetical protein K439DRAFT_1658713 [Ramaria rubella]